MIDMWWDSMKEWCIDVHGSILSAMPASFRGPGEDYIAWSLLMFPILFVYYYCVTGFVYAVVCAISATSTTVTEVDEEKKSARTASPEDGVYKLQPRHHHTWRMFLSEFLWAQPALLTSSFIVGLIVTLGLQGKTALYTI